MRVLAGEGLRLTRRRERGELGGNSQAPVGRVDWPSSSLGARPTGKELSDEDHRSLILIED